MQNETQTREQKRAQFSQSPKGKSKTTSLLIAAALVVVAIAAYLVISTSSDKPATTTIATGADAGSGAATTGDIRIPISDLGNKAKFFDYKLADNKPMRFFVLKSSDGVYRAALDACDTCYHAKKGYHQEGDDMVCNNCGLHFHSAKINEVQGGCNPVGLPRTVEGDSLIIKASDLESRKQYF